MSEDNLPFLEIQPHIADLAERLMEHEDRDVADLATEMLDWIDVFNATGIGRLVDLIRDWRGEVFLEAAAADPLVGPLLSVYGLGEGIDVDQGRAAVQAALTEVRPYLHSHGGDMEVVDVTDGVVRLKLHGSCDGCTASATTIAERVEGVLREGWVDFRRIEVEEMTAEAHPPPAPGAVVTGLQIRPSDGHGR